MAKYRLLTTCGGCAFCLALEPGYACFHPMVHTQPVDTRLVEFNNEPPAICPLPKGRIVITCSHCSGRGEHDPFSKCNACQGKGEIPV